MADRPTWAGKVRTAATGPQCLSWKRVTDTIDRNMLTMLPMPVIAGNTKPKRDCFAKTARSDESRSCRKSFLRCGLTRSVSDKSLA